MERCSSPNDSDTNLKSLVDSGMVAVPEKEGMNSVSAVEPCSRGDVMELRSHDDYSTVQPREGGLDLRVRGVTGNGPLDHERNDSPSAEELLELT